MISTRCRPFLPQPSPAGKCNAVTRVSAAVGQSLHSEACWLEVGLRALMPFADMQASCSDRSTARWP